MIKKITLITLAALFTVNVWGQTLYVPNGTSGIDTSTTGNVGIGTNSPIEPLSVNTGNNAISITSATGVKGFFASYNDEIQLGSNRNPGNGVFGDVNLSSSVIKLVSKNIDSYIQFSTTKLNGTNPIERMRIDKDGNVGIGTTSPKSKLAIGNNYSDPSIYPNKITLWEGGENNYYGFGISVGDLDYFTQSNHRFYTEYNGTPGTEKFTILANGNVGIGTTNPESKLDIQQSSNEEWAAMIKNAGGSGKGLLIRSAASTDVPILQVEDNYTNVRFVVKSNGNVGIGTTSPSTLFEVAKNQAVGTYIQVRNSNTNTGAAAGFKAYGEAGKYFDLITIPAAYSGNSWTASLLIRSTLLNGISMYSSGGYRVQTTAGVNTFNVINNNVGIGTTTIPAGYKLAVNGKIIATEIQVETGWADFVFEPTYNLMPLNELNTYIQKNKHLPEIPTTAEVQENGISVGEMNAKLLQKIEELTLHTIQQQELIEALLNRVENLEKNN
jgi:hypothetical protein